MLIQKQPKSNVFFENYYVRPVCIRDQIRRRCSGLQHGGSLPKVIWSFSLMAKQPFLLEERSPG